MMDIGHPPGNRVFERDHSERRGAVRERPEGVLERRAG